MCRGLFLCQRPLHSPRAFCLPGTFLLARGSLTGENTGDVLPQQSGCYSRERQMFAMRCFHPWLSRPAILVALFVAHASDARAGYWTITVLDVPGSTFTEARGIQG